MKLLKGSLTLSAISVFLAALMSATMFTGCSDDQDIHEGKRKIAYDANGETFVGTLPAIEEVASGTQITVPAASAIFHGINPTGTMFALTSWNTKSDGSGITYATGEKVRLVADMVLYAQWRPIDEESETVVIFEPNTPTFTGDGPAPIILSRTANAAARTISFPASGSLINRSADEVSIVGWNTAKDFSGEHYNIRETYVVPADAPAVVRFFAKWEPWGNVKISWYVGAKRSGDKNILAGDADGWAVKNAGFKASVKKAYLSVRYPYLEAGHWTTPPTTSLRHAAGSVQMLSGKAPDCDDNSGHPVAGMFAVDLTSANDVHLGTSDKNDNGDLLDGGEYGSPWMRLSFPNDISVPNSSARKEAATTTNPANNVDGWWGVMQRNAELATNAVGISGYNTLKEKNAGYYFSGELEVTDENGDPVTYTYEVIGDYTVNIQTPRPTAFPTYYLRSGETLHFVRRLDASAWLTNVLLRYNVFFDFATLADEENHIVFSFANPKLATYKAPFLSFAQAPANNAGAGNANVKPELQVSRTHIMALIDFEIRGNIDNWSFEGTRIEKAAN